MKEVSCADVGYFPECEWTGQGHDESDVMAQAAQHARDVHGLTADDLTDERVQTIRAHIKDI